MEPVAQGSAGAGGLNPCAEQLCSWLQFQEKGSNPCLSLALERNRILNKKPVFPRS